MKTIKITTLIIITLIAFSCNSFNLEVKQEDKTMIKPAIHNAINFSDDFNRESEFFDINLQRVESFLSDASAYLVFEYIPDTMPTTSPTCKLTWDSESVLQEYGASHIVELDDRYIVYFSTYLGMGYANVENSYFYVDIDDSRIYSERYTMIPLLDLSNENIKTLKAYNNDATHGYLTSTYPACGFFKVSELNRDDLGVDKVEYESSYGGIKILRSENFIKKRFRFVGLSMYQRNLLKFLCNTNHLFIDGVEYRLKTEFTEVGRNEENETFDLQAEFVAAEHSFFTTGATSVARKIQPTNLFMK